MLRSFAAHGSHVSQDGGQQGGLAAMNRGSGGQGGSAMDKETQDQIDAIKAKLAVLQQQHERDLRQAKRSGPADVALLTTRSGSIREQALMATKSMREEKKLVRPSPARRLPRKRPPTRPMSLARPVPLRRRGPCSSSGRGSVLTRAEPVFCIAGGGRSPPPGVPAVAYRQQRQQQRGARPRRAFARARGRRQRGGAAAGAACIPTEASRRGDGETRGAATRPPGRVRRRP